MDSLPPQPPWMPDGQARMPQWAITQQMRDIRDREERLLEVQAETLRDLPDALRAALGPDDRGRFRGLVAKVEDLTSRLQSCHSSRQFQESELRRERSRLILLQLRLDNFERERDRNVAKIRRLEAGLPLPNPAHERYVVTLERSVAELKRQVQTLESQNQELSSQLATLEKSLEEPENDDTRAIDNAKATEGLDANSNSIETLEQLVQGVWSLDLHESETYWEDSEVIGDIDRELKILKNRDMALRFRADAASSGFTSSRRVARDVANDTERLHVAIGMIEGIRNRCNVES